MKNDTYDDAFNRLGHVSVCQTFEEMETLWEEQGFGALEGTDLVVIVPSLDEQGRSIFVHDKDLFYFQKECAERIAEFLLLDSVRCRTHVILEGKDRIDFLNKHGIPLHNVVFLSKFAAFTHDEKSGIMNALRQTRFAMPAVFELSS